MEPGYKNPSSGSSNSPQIGRVEQGFDARKADCYQMDIHEAPIRAFPKIGVGPQMDGENNGKPHFLMDDLEVPLFSETSIHGRL